MYYVRRDITHYSSQKGKKLGGKHSLDEMNPITVTAGRRVPPGLALAGGTTDVV